MDTYIGHVQRKKSWKKNNKHLIATLTVVFSTCMKQKCTLQLHQGKPKKKKILTKIEAVSYWATILKQVYYNKLKKSIKLLNKKLWLTWFVELLKLYTQLLTIAAYSQKPFEKKALLHPFKAHLITISRGDALPDLLGRLKIIYHHHVLVNEGKQIQDASNTTVFLLLFFFLLNFIFYSFM